MGTVTLHMDLKPKSDPSFKVLGGGYWYADKEKKILYLWGESIDFGFAKPDDIVRAINSPDTWVSPSMEGWDVLHSDLISNDMPIEDSFVKLTTIPIYP